MADGATIGECVRDQMIKEIWSQSDVARNMGVSQGYISMLFRKRPDEPGPKVIGRLLKAMKLPPTFFSRNGQEEEP